MERKECNGDLTRKILRLCDKVENVNGENGGKITRGKAQGRGTVVD